MTITTVAEDPVRKCFTQVAFPLDTSGISSSLSKVHLEFDVEDLKKKANPYYKVVIENLHHTDLSAISVEHRFVIFDDAVFESDETVDAKGL